MPITFFTSTNSACRFLVIQFLLLVILLCFPFDAFSNEAQRNFMPSKALLVSRFDSLDRRLNNGQACIGFDNSVGSLAWGASYMLSSYIDMYIGTGAKKYLEKFCSQADWICQVTDSARGIFDYKGRKRIGWSSNNNSKGNVPMLHMVHTGMIVYPLLRFCLLTDQLKSSEYTVKCDNYRSISISALAEFDRQWHYDKINNEGFYAWEGDEPIKASHSIPNAMNCQLALGRCNILLYRLTKKAEYQEKSKNLGNYFKNRISRNAAGSIFWPYRHDLLSVNVLEDVSHGAIAASFALEAYKAGIVFTKEDIASFITIPLKLKSGTSFKYVDGTGLDTKYKDIKCGRTFQRSYSDAFGRWIDLCALNYDLFYVLLKYFERKFSVEVEPDPQILLALAKLVRYYPTQNIEN